MNDQNKPYDPNKPYNPNNQYSQYTQYIQSEQNKAVDQYGAKVQKPQPENKKADIQFEQFEGYNPDDQLERYNPNDQQDRYSQYNRFEQDNQQEQYGQNNSYAQQQPNNQYGSYNQGNQYNRYKSSPQYDQYVPSNQYDPKNRYDYSNSNSRYGQQALDNQYDRYGANNQYDRYAQNQQYNQYGGTGNQYGGADNQYGGADNQYGGYGQNNQHYHAQNNANGQYGQNNTNNPYNLANQQGQYGSNNQVQSNNINNRYNQYLSDVQGNSDRANGRSDNHVPNYTSANNNYASSGANRPGEKPVLELSKISYYYTAKKYIIKDFSYKFYPGRVYAIIGKSGSGKTTLLSLMSGLDNVKEGNIYYKGNDITHDKKYKYRSNDIGVIFQSYNLINKYTALENVELSMDISKNKFANKRQIAHDKLESVGISGEEQNRRILHLSGGQQQRVAIARTLSYDPSVILADEPTGNLDPENQDQVMDIFADLAYKQNKCVIIVTHSQSVADRADEVCEIFPLTKKRRKR